MRTLLCLATCTAALACGGESVSPEELDFRAFEVPFDESADLTRLDATVSAGTVHLVGVLPVAACAARAVLDASRDGNQLTLVLHMTFEPPSVSDCPQEPPLFGYEAFVRNVEPGTFSAEVFYTSQLQQSNSGGSLTIDVP